jgi:hypothetical protein
MWHTTWDKDPFSTVCLISMDVGMAALWAVSLREEQKNFYDRRSQRLHRKMVTLGHIGVLLIATLAASADQNRIGLWIILALFAFYANVTWAAWMRSRFLPPEDQAVIDAIHDREDQQAAAAYDASEKERRRQRLNGIVTGLGYQITDTPADQSSEEVPEQTHHWLVPTGKHAPLVYFIRNGNRMKIGTSTEVKRRIRTLALRAENVALLLDGDRRIERQLHAQFADLRIGNSEWFAYESPLTDYVTDQNRLARKEEAK